MSDRQPSRHADTLRGMAGLSYSAADALLAGAAALDTLERVRAVRAGLRGEQEAALQRWDDTGDIWDGATSDTLQDTIHLLTEVLGDTP